MLHLVCLMLAVGYAGAGDLESETSQLEGLEHSGKITAVQAGRLSEIYFLTSRCAEVRKTLKLHASATSANLVCACGGACLGGSEVSSMARFKKLLDSGMKWKEARVQALWRKVDHMPEARYWALKKLRLDPSSFRDPNVLALRKELEQSLESLEVTP